MDVGDLRGYWAALVPELFAPQANCDCLNITFDEVRIRNELLQPLERLITGSSTPGGVLARLKTVDDPPTLCGRVFKSGEPTYSCRDCGLDPTCVLCVDCFKNSAHKNHRYKMSMSNGGGYCDCGDKEAWRLNPFCDVHIQGVLNESTDNDPLSRLPAELQPVIERTKLLMSRVVNYCFEILTWDNNLHLPDDLSVTNGRHREVEADTYATMLFNDEIHTYEQVINTLSRAIDCNQKDAIEYATTIDREGRSIVRCAAFTNCQSVKTVIERITSRHGSKPLRVDVMHTDVVAHQTFAIRLLSWLQTILGHCEAFRCLFAEILMDKPSAPDPVANIKSSGIPLLEQIMKADTRLWKSMRNQWHQLFITGLLMDAKSKKEFAKMFTRNYGSLMKDFINDDHEHSVSITSLSVQLFTVPTLAQALIAEENAIVLLLKTFTTECGRYRNHDGKLAFERNHSMTSFRRAQYILYDLKYLLAVRPQEWTEPLRKNFLHGVSTLVELLVWMQGMDAVVRQVGQHVEFEAEWETGINLQLKLAPIESLVIEWCSSDRSVLIKSLRNILRELFDQMMSAGKQPPTTTRWELVGHGADCIDYDVSSMPVTIHLPLCRLVAGLLLQLGKYDLNYNEPNFLVGKKPAPFQLMELPLRTQVMVAQFRAGMWRRNGYSLVNQVYFYHNVRLRDEMFDRDILMLQIGAARLDPNQYLIHLLNKFGLLFWAQDNYEGLNRKPEEDYVRQTISLVEEFFGLLLMVVSERFVPGLGKVTLEDKIKKEIIQWLSMEPMTHSELVKYLPKETHSYEFSIEDVIKQVAVFKKSQSAAASGKYELKPEYFNDFNPFFYHYTRQDQSNAEEAQLKRKKQHDEELICCPPPVPPDFTPQFAAITGMLTCDVFVHLVQLVLKRTCNLHAVSYSETQFEKVLHLIGVGLHEEQKGTFDGQSQMFTDKCQEKAVLSALEECLKCTRIDVHKDLLRWTIRKFNEVVSLKKKDSTSDQTAGHSLLTSSDEQPTESGQSTAKSDRKRSAEAAAARRARIMAQMTEMQKSFIREHAEYFKDSTDEGMNEAESMMDLAAAEPVPSDPVAVGAGQTPRAITNQVHTCILCREEQEVSVGGKCMVLSAFVQRSTVLSKNRDRQWPSSADSDTIDPLLVPADLCFGPHMSTCGHVMHSDCWQKFFETVLIKERRRPIRYGRHVSFDVDKNEFLCPLCECLSNCVIPMIPAIGGSSDQKLDRPPISISAWLIGLHAAVEKFNHHSEDQGERFAPLLVPQPLSEVAKVIDSEADWFRSLFADYQASGLTADQLSESLLTIMKLLAQSIYTISLGLPPNSEDVRQPLQAYWTCAYTIHAIERVLRADNRPIFSDLSSRKYHCLQALVRFVGSSSVVFDKPVLASHCVRLLRFLLVAEHHSTSPMCLLDIDAFSLLVSLTVTTPCLYLNEASPNKVTTPTGNASDQNLVHLILVFHLVQIFLTQSASGNFNEEPMEVENQDFVMVDADEDADSSLVNFYKDVIAAAGLTLARQPSGQSISSIAKSGLLPFLRSAALFFHFLTNVAPPTRLKEGSHPLTPGEEFAVLTAYLGLSSQTSALLEPSPVRQLALSWCRHPRLSLILSTSSSTDQQPTEIPTRLILQPHSINQLVPLPADYSELVNGVSQFTCPNSDGDDSRSPTMCLVCGQILCSQSYCCQSELESTMVGACTRHAHICGAGVGLFLRIRDCKILLLAGKTKGCYLDPPYIDEYGETDQGLLRGNPLHLCSAAYQELHRRWLSHGIPEQIAHALELSSNLAATNWQLL